MYSSLPFVVYTYAYKMLKSFSLYYEKLFTPLFTYLLEPFLDQIVLYFEP